MMVEVKPSYMAVAIDETEYFNIDDQDKPMIEKILAVYFYDKTERTFLCEGTPSYSLHGVHYSIYTVDGISDEDRERIQDTYGSEYPEDTYKNVWRVEAIPGQIELGEAYEDADEVRDDLQGNWRF